MTTARAFRSFEALRPSEPGLVACTHCDTVVETVDGRGRCDDCGADRLLILLDEVSTVDLAVAVDVGRFSFARRDLARCEAELAADEAYTSWLADRRDSANALQAAEVDARAEALRARAVRAEVSAWDARDAGHDDVSYRHGARAERLWTARDAATALARKVAAREVA